MTLFEFMLGSLCYKGKWISKAKELVQKLSTPFRVIEAVVIVMAMLIGHTLIVRSLFIAPATGLVIIFLFSLWKKPHWVEQTFLFIGKHSTNIWLTHMFFYLYIFKNLVYKAHYPLLILATMMGLSILCSMVINLKKIFKETPT